MGYMRTKVLLAAVTVSMAATSSSFAGVISGITFAGPGLGTVNPVLTDTTAPNNDDYTGTGIGNPNLLGIIKTFDAVNYIDLIFDVSNSSGTTEYYLTEPVTNNTGLTWTDFHWELGFGTGINFVPSGNGDFLDFDQPFPQNPLAVIVGGAFSTVQLGADPDTIWFLDGMLADGGNTIFETPIDVPDSTNIPSAFVTANGYTFTLRQIPTIPVPEPGTLALFGLGLAGLGFIRRKRAA